MDGLCHRDRAERTRALGQLWVSPWLRRTVIGISNGAVQRRGLPPGGRFQNADDLRGEVELRFYVHVERVERAATPARFCGKPDPWRDLRNFLWSVAINILNEERKKHEPSIAWEFRQAHRTLLAARTVLQEDPDLSAGRIPLWLQSVADDPALVAGVAARLVAVFDPADNLSVRESERDLAVAVVRAAVTEASRRP